MVMAYCLFRTLQHYVLTVRAGNKFGGAVRQGKPRSADIAIVSRTAVMYVSRIAGRIISMGGDIWMVRVIAAQGLSGTAFKTSGNHQISQTALYPGRGCYNCFQGGSALKVHCNGRNGFRKSCLQGHETGNVAPSSHTVAADNHINL